MASTEEPNKVPNAGAGKRSDALLQVLAEQPDAQVWSESDLTAILRHQYATQLHFELQAFADGAALPVAWVRQVLAASDCRTFGDVLSRDEVTADLLRLVKDYAKAAMEQPDVLPREVAHVLYVSALCQAHRLGLQQVTSMQADAVRHQARLCLTHGWLSEEMRRPLRFVQ